MRIHESQAKRLFADCGGPIVPLIMHQIGPEGHVVQTLPVDKATKIASELFLGLAFNRARWQIAKRRQFVK